jgi:disulfide bond formation protein DsbB
MRLTFVFKLNNTCLITFIFSVLIVFTSIFSEIVLHKIPCQLCLISRYFYVCVAISSGVSVFFEKIKILPLVFVTFSLIFTLYHLGVENHWWLGPQSCVSELPTLDNVVERTFIDNGKAYCDQVNWKIFGVSSTLLVFLLSAFLFWYNSISCVLFLYLRGENGKK